MADSRLLTLLQIVFIVYVAPAVSQIFGSL